jgi:hypothetical protein
VSRTSYHFFFRLILVEDDLRELAPSGLKHGLAVMGPAKFFVDDGALASYGPDFLGQWHRAGSHGQTSK